MKLGIIGCGGIARRRVLPALEQSDRVSVTAVEDVSLEVAEESAREFHVPRAYQSVPEVLNDPDVDAVYIASPLAEHYEHVRAAAEARKHVFCEKPLALNASLSAELVEMCDEYRVTLQVGFMMRYHPLHKQVRDLLCNGVLGRPVYGRAQLTCWYPPMDGAWRQRKATSGGGAFMDLAIHTVDLLRFLFGEVRSVYAVSGNLAHDYEVEDSGVIVLTFESGAYGVCESFFSVPDEAAESVLEVYGSNGSVRSTGTIGQLPGGSAVLSRGTGRVAYDDLQQREQEHGEQMSWDADDLYRAEFEDFVEAVDTASAPMNTGREAVAAQRIIEAAYTASRTGSVVALLP